MWCPKRVISSLIWYIVSYKSDLFDNTTSEYLTKLEIVSNSFNYFLVVFFHLLIFFTSRRSFFWGGAVVDLRGWFNKQPGTSLDSQARHHILRGLVVSGCICRFYAFGVGTGEAEGSARGLDDVLESELRTVELPMRVTEKVRKKLLFSFVSVFLSLF